MSKVVFRLARYYPPWDDVYEAIKTGEKKVEYREATEYWAKRLLTTGMPSCPFRSSYMHHAKQKKAWLLVGFPKGNTPRLEADIVDIIYDPDNGQFEVHLDNVVEVTS